MVASQTTHAVSVINIQYTQNTLMHTCPAGRANKFEILLSADSWHKALSFIAMGGDVMFSGCQSIGTYIFGELDFSATL